MISNTAPEIQIQEELINCEPNDQIQTVICKICYMLLEKPILVCTNCGFFACKRCIKNWQKNTLNQNCPQKCSANAAFLEKSIPSLETVFDLITIKCPYSQNESKEQQCNFLMKYHQVEEHVSNCQFKLGKCKFIGCEKKLCLRELDDHYKNCSFNKAKCKFCLKLLNRQDQEKHQSECDLRIINCDNQGCMMKMQYSKRSHHLDQCRFRLVECDQCNQKFQFRYKEEHLKSNCTNRLTNQNQCSSQILKNEKQEHDNQNSQMKQLDGVDLQGQQDQNIEKVANNEGNLPQQQKMEEEQTEIIMKESS